MAPRKFVKKPRYNPNTPLEFIVFRAQSIEPEKETRDPLLVTDVTCNCVLMYSSGYVIEISAAPAKPPAINGKRCSVRALDSVSFFDTETIGRSFIIVLNDDSFVVVVVVVVVIATSLLSFALL